MERWRELCTSLDICDKKTGKAVTGHVKKEEVPDTSFSLSLIGIVYRNHTFKYSTTTCLHIVCVSGVSPAGRFFFIVVVIIITKLCLKYFM